MSRMVYRLHEWCARHIKGVQYPALLVARTAPQTKLWWPVRLFLFCWAMVAIPVGLALLFLAGLILWAVVRSLFGG